MNLTDLNISQNGDEYIAIVGKRMFKIDYLFYSIIEKIKQNNSLTTAIDNVAKQNNLSPIELSVSFNKFITEINKSYKTRESYIKCRFSLCSERVVIILSKLFRPLFNTTIFWSLIILGTVISIVFATMDDRAQTNIDFFNSYQLLTLSSLCFIFTFFHEIGHASASYQMGCPASNIGMGFYIFLPVFFTDVSRIWTLPKRKRLLVNIGGIYFQLLINILLILGYFLIKNDSAKEWFLYLFASNSVVITTSLLPFFRNDGYWIVSDLLGIPNLLKQSDIWISRALIGRIEHRNPKIIIFAILNQLFRLWIISKIILALFQIISDCIYSSSLSSNLNSIIWGILLLVALYLMCVTQIKKTIRYAKRK